MNELTLLMSPADSKLLNYFKKQYQVLESDVCDFTVSYEKQHADMQALKINNTLFINAKCQKLCDKLKEKGIEATLCEGIGQKYPENVALNAALVGDKLLCKESALHPFVKEFCIKNSIKIINVNQGYTKCSTLILNENTIITDDDSIFERSLINNINVLKIEKGDIILTNDTYGFIGGASTVINNTVYFFGNINTHRNCKEIKAFIAENNMNMVSVTDNKLKDIGGIVKL